jgi:hypothetical protein
LAEEVGDKVKYQTSLMFVAITARAGSRTEEVGFVSLKALKAAKRSDCSNICAYVCISSVEVAIYRTEP